MVFSYDIIFAIKATPPSEAILGSPKSGLHHEILLYFCGNLRHIAEVQKQSIMPKTSQLCLLTRRLIMGKVWKDCLDSFGRLLKLCKLLFMDFRIAHFVFFFVCVLSDLFLLFVVV